MKIPLTPRLVPLLVSWALLAPAVRADVRLPAIISDHMVLQQEVPANVWGWADAGEKVSVTFAGASASATAGADGAWSVKLPPLSTGTIGDLTVVGKNSLTVRNVVVGEVWVCSGQSNMEWTVNGAANPQEEAKAANYPLLRMFTVKKKPATEPQQDCEGQWEVCTPETAPRFSAVGYYFARHVHQTIKQPIGMIHSSWGGTPAEFWVPTPILKRDPAFEPIFKAWDAAVAAYPKAKENYAAALEKWREADKAAKAAGQKSPPAPRAPRGGDAFGSPGCLYNGMIEPIADYTIRGAIWYQGESNASQAQLYKKLFPTMIKSWRAMWGAEFPFLFVQLANFKARAAEPTDTDWARLREAQLETLELPRTGMAVAIDIGEADDIHPKNKQEVGRRLALIAEASVYYVDQEFSGPIYTGGQAEDGKYRLSFRNSDGLQPAEGDKLKGFAIAGADRKFVWADAVIEGDHVIVSNPQVAEPVAVRYAWADNPECNLVNATGLPASPFRTDEWPLAAAK
jgi:sialate O-acetylesterase